MRTAALGLLGLMVCGTALASPVSVTHQGRLLDASGGPVNGQAEVLFELANSQGGGATFSLTRTVDVADGYYSLVVSHDTNDEALDSTVFEAAEWIRVTTAGVFSEQLITHVPRAAVASAVVGDVRLTGDNVLVLGQSSSDGCTEDGGLVYDPDLDQVKVCVGGDWRSIGTGTQESDKYRFTSCGQTGRAGPSQSACNSAYASTTLAGDVIVSAGVQAWTVPVTGTYRITARGAEGAVGTYAGGTHAVGLGGLGAEVTGEFMLTSGTVIKVLVGQMGVAPAHNAYGHQPGGGGGGTFVVSSTNSPMVVAGGGGGGNDPSYGFAQGGHGRLETSGESVVHNTSYQSTGGSNGSGGVVGGSNNYVGTGAGFSGNGTARGSVGAVAQSFLSGGVGGFATNHAITAHGGFGGGGGAELCAGGGGGYSGGGACCGWSSYSRSGGGGSFNAGVNQASEFGENHGPGSVEITYLQ